MKKLVGACACALAVVGIAAGATVWAFQANSG
jgi:hypothetical protein